MLPDFGDIRILAAQVAPAALFPNHDPDPNAGRRLDLRRWCASPSTNRSGEVPNASQIRSSVIKVIGRPASIICQVASIKAT